VADEKRVRSLEDLLAEEGLLPLPRAIDLVGQIAAALEVARANQRTIERLEPSSVQITAAEAEKSGVAARAMVVGLIGAEDLPVRPGGPRAIYLAPEVVAGDYEASRGSAAHQFALAAIAYEMLAGCPAFPEEIGDNRDNEGAAADALRAAPPPVSEMVLGAAAGLDEIFARALATDPARRFPRIEDFFTALHEVSDPGSVWDDGATVIWSPAAGDMEPPPLSPRVTPPAIRRVSAVHAVVRTQSARLADVARQVKSSAGAWAERLRARQRPAHMRKVTPNPLPRPPVTDSVSDTGSLPPPLALASFPAHAMPSRRTQVSFLAAAAVLVLGAVVVMSGSRVRPPLDAASDNVPVVVPAAELIRPRARPGTDMARPSALQAQPPVAPATPAPSPPTSRREDKGASTLAAVSTSTTRQAPAIKATRRHSRHGVARVASSRH
jgi:hypothetical protein